MGKNKTNYRTEKHNYCVHVTQLNATPNHLFVLLACAPSPDVSLDGDGGMEEHLAHPAHQVTTDMFLDDHRRPGPLQGHRRNVLPTAGGKWK